MPSAPTPLRSLEHESDETLGAAVLRGDEAAFRELYRRHTPRVRMLVARLVDGVNADSDDVVQEAWIRAVRGLREFRWDAAFGTWLGAIGVRVCHEMFRRQKRWGFIGSELPEHATVAPVHEHERIDLEAAIARLPDAYRAVLVLHDIEGMTHVEIGKRLEIPEGTSKSALSRARGMMRKYLGGPRGAGYGGRGLQGEENGK